MCGILECERYLWSWERRGWGQSSAEGWQSQRVTHTDTGLCWQRMKVGWPSAQLHTLYATSKWAIDCCHQICQIFWVWGVLCVFVCLSRSSPEKAGVQCAKRLCFYHLCHFHDWDIICQILFCTVFYFLHLIKVMLGTDERVCALLSERYCKMFLVT